MPQAGDYSAADVGAYSATQTDTLLASKSNVGHTHVAADVFGVITSVNGQGGSIVALTTNDIPEGSNLYYTAARVQATAPNVTLGTANGLSVAAGQVLSLAAATSGAAGAMSAADKAKLDGATDISTANAIVRRDASGNFTAGTIRAGTISSYGNLTIQPVQTSPIGFGLILKGGDASDDGGDITIAAGAGGDSVGDVFIKTDWSGGVYIGPIASPKITVTSSGVGFFGVSPVAKPTSTTDLRQALINLGLYSSGGATPLNLNGGALTAGTVKSTGAQYIGAPSTAPTDANIAANQISFYLDESGNNLKVRVRYSGSTYKTATIALA